MDQWSPVHIAVMSGNVEFVKAILEEGSFDARGNPTDKNLNVDSDTKDDHELPAIAGMSLSATERRINDVDEKSEKDEESDEEGVIPSPLWLAVKCQEMPDFRMITFLCIHGADPLLDLPIDILQEIPLQAAFQLKKIYSSPEEYHYRFILFTFMLRVAELVGLYAQGKLSHQQYQEEVSEIELQRLQLEAENGGLFVSDSGESDDDESGSDDSNDNDNVNDSDNKVTASDDNKGDDADGDKDCKGK